MAGPWPEQASEIAANPYYNPYAQAGEEVSSSNEGRTIYVQEILLVHVDNGDGLVDKGQPVAFWEGVGIAMKSATSTSENVPIDTEGIWRVSVVGTAAIYVGQSLFINTSGVVTDSPVDGQAVFGYALQQTAGAGTFTIAVKVHWMALNWLWLIWWMLNQQPF
jgi:predicted RecA/RadA family phage recombinase